MIITYYSKQYNMSYQETKDYLFGVYTPEKASYALRKVINIISKESDNDITDKALRELGISVRNKNGSYKLFKDVLDEISNKLDKK